ncbi:MAG: hypothetical protein GF353_04225 [Candidatus Lokiarchaeota archaeon]|nr:hypothetical protein [Candidatus Lokiarchaeota archaeon]
MDQENKSGYKKTKIGWIPEGWKIRELRNIANIVAGGTPSRKKKEYWNGSIPWLTTSLVSFNRINETEEFISEVGLSNSSAKLFKKGTLIMAMYGQGKTRGRVGILEIDAATNQACAGIVVNKKSIDKYYLFHNLCFRYNEIREIGHGGNQKNLNAELIRNIPIPIPVLFEQKKIVQILNTWDNGIEITQKLITAKEQQKKALMQQLLVGKKRFPEFENYEWREYKYNELLLEVRRAVSFKDNERYHLISVRRRSAGLFQRESMYGRQIKTKDLRIAKAGDFIISKMQIVHGASGLVTEKFDGMKISGSYIALVVKNQNLLAIEFLDWLSKMPYFYHQTFISSYGVHIEKMTFDFKTFLKLKIYVPSNIEEQQKIASVLQTADKEIGLLKKKLTKLQQQKKGLMQVLLTGKIRVKIDEDKTKNPGF